MKKPPERHLVWKNVILLTLLHFSALVGVFYLPTLNVSTLLWGYFCGMISGLGITAGAHRLWGHRTYKAHLPLKLILLFFNSMALETPIYDWVRDHRVHHKFTDTNADPHNAQRGFFFAHMGWLLLRKHPEVLEKGRKLDLSDLQEDGIVMFQKKYYMFFAPVLSLLFPAVIPWYFFETDFFTAWFTACALRYTVVLHCTWSVNSVAHFWGFKPYDRFIKPTENLGVAICALGEGWHNYHHVFPWDYKTAELGNYRANLTTAFIDFMAWLGWAYDRKTVSEKMIKRLQEKKAADL